jgi:hypothetical protein
VDTQLLIEIRDLLKAQASKEPLAESDKVIGGVPPAP